MDPKGTICAVSGNIIAIQYEKGFHYMGCKKCKKKVYDKVCERCKEENTETPIYMFNIKVSDGTDSVWVHVFADQGETILGKNAAEVLQLQQTDEVAFKRAFEKPKGSLYTMLVRVKKEVYEEKEIVKYQMVRMQKPNWKEENKGMLKKIETYLAKAA